MRGVRVSDEQTSGLTYSFRVVVEGAHVAGAVDQRLKRAGRTARVPGFRRGRAPLPILRQRFGVRTRDDVVDQTAIGVARRLIGERGLEPIRRPVIHMDPAPAALDADVAFTLVLEAAPRIELDDLDGFELERLRPQPSQPALEEASELDLRRQLFDALVARYPFPVPDDMVENEYQRIAGGYRAEVGEAVDAALAAELRAIAERRVRLAILLSEIGRVHGIRVPREEVEALVAEQAERDPEHESEVVEYYLDHPTALAELQSPLFEDHVVAFLLERSRIADVDVSPDELRARVEPA